MPVRAVVLRQVGEDVLPIVERAQLRLVDCHVVRQKVHHDGLRRRTDPLLHNRNRDFYGIVPDAQLIARNVILHLAGGRLGKHEVYRLRIEHIPGGGCRFDQTVSPVRPKRPAQGLQVADDQDAPVRPGGEGHVLAAAVPHGDLIAVLDVEQLERRPGQRVGDHLGVALYKRDARIARRAAAGRRHGRVLLDGLFIFAELYRVGIRHISAAQNPRLIGDLKGRLVRNLGEGQRIRFFVVLHHNRVVRGRYDQRVRNEAQVGGQNVPNRQHVGGRVQVLRVLVDDDLELRDVSVVRRGAGQKLLIHIGEIRVAGLRRGRKVVPRGRVLQRDAVLGFGRVRVQLLQRRGVLDDQRVFDPIKGVVGVRRQHGKLVYGDVHSVGRVRGGSGPDRLRGRGGRAAGYLDAAGLIELQILRIERVVNDDPVRRRAGHCQHIVKHRIRHAVDDRLRPLHELLFKRGLGRIDDVVDRRKPEVAGPGAGRVPVGIQQRRFIPILRGEVQPVLIDRRLEPDHNVARLPVGRRQEAGVRAVLGPGFVKGEREGPLVFVEGHPPGLALEQALDLHGAIHEIVDVRLPAILQLRQIVRDPQI